MAATPMPVDPAAPWDGGWWRGARALPSPNVSPRPEAARVDLIVVHSISLPPGAYGGDEVFRLFTNTLDWDAHPYFGTIRGLEVSSHFFIRRDGTLWQFVDCDLKAWHAGRSFYRGRMECNDDSVGVELEGLEGDLFEPAQYRTLAALCEALRGRHPIAHVAGHSHVAPGRKQDPGPGFDWARLQHLLCWPPSFFPAAAADNPRPPPAASAPEAERP